MTAQLTTMQKAFEINMDPVIYGTLAEIGAGQEVSRYFFLSGGAAGTIAKTISAYDMRFSDALYGKEASGRYVSENAAMFPLGHYEVRKNEESNHVVEFIAHVHLDIR